MRSCADDRLLAALQVGASWTSRLGSRKGDDNSVLSFGGKQEITACRIYILKMIGDDENE